MGPSASSTKASTKTGTSGRNPNVFFGAPLDVAANHPNNVVENLPYPVWHLFQYLETEKGFHFEGLHRIAGKSTQIADVRSIYDSGGQPDLVNMCSIPSATGLLKAYLRALPEPVITFELLDSFLSAAEIQDDAKRTSLLRSHVRALPPPNFVVLKRLIRHLRNVAAYAHVNKMSPDNLSIVYAPNLMKRRDASPLSMMEDVSNMNSVVKHLLTDYRAIFEDRSDFDGMMEGSGSAAYQSESVEGGKSPSAPPPSWSGTQEVGFSTNPTKAPSAPLAPPIPQIGSEFAEDSGVCSACGSAVGETSKFCAECGKPVERGSSDYY